MATIDGYVVKYEPMKGVAPFVIKSALVTEGPIAGAVYASHDFFKNYKAGVLRASQCE